MSSERTTSILPSSMLFNVALIIIQGLLTALVSMLWWYLVSISTTVQQVKTCQDQSMWISTAVAQLQHNYETLDNRTRANETSIARLTK